MSVFFFLYLCIALTVIPVILGIICWVYERKHNLTKMGLIKYMKHFL